MALPLYSQLRTPPSTFMLRLTLNVRLSPRYPPDRNLSRHALGVSDSTVLRIEASEGGSDQTAAHNLELPCDLARHLGGAGPARRILAARDRHERVLDEAQFALGGRTEAAEVARLDA